MEDYENSPVAERATFRRRPRIHCDANNVEKLAVSGRKVNALVLVSFGVLCMTQATLNVVLRLYLTEGKGVGSDCSHSLSALQTSHQTLSKQRDELEQQLRNIKTLLKENWRFFKGIFYLTDTERMSWTDSRLYCLQRGADLLVINSPEEREFVMTYERRSWIGLTDREQEGVWRWVDGSLLTTSFWMPDEPNNDHGKEHCVEVLSNKTMNWNDRPCDDKMQFICEKKIY